MLYCYGITQQGYYHIKNNIVCQDSHYIKKVNDNYVVAAAADGLGSEDHSDMGSSIAAKTACEFCASKISEESVDEEILQVIRDSFEAAYSEIEKNALENEYELNQCDTTLSLAVIIGDRVYCGQSGDSGIIVLDDQGKYESATVKQQDDYGCVFPLVFKDKWEFFKVDRPVASTLLASDGIYDLFFPYLLHGEEQPMHIALVEFFMNPELIDIKNQGEEKVKERIEKAVADIPEETASDDKTVVVIANDEVKIHWQEESYYQEPDWEALEEKKKLDFEKVAYPHRNDERLGEEAQEAEKEPETVKAEEQE